MCDCLSKSKSKKDTYPKDEIESETVCFIVWHKGRWVQQVDLLCPQGPE